MLNCIFLIFSLAILRQAGAPRFDIHTAGDKSFVGNIRAMTADNKITLEDGTAIAGKNLVSLRRSDSPIPGWPRGSQIVLHSGDRIAGSPIKISGPFLVFRLDRGAAQEAVSARFPLTSIDVLWLRGSGRIDDERLIKPRDSDRVFLKNGDAISGTVIDLNSENGEMQVDVGEETKTVLVNKLEAIMMSKKLARARKPSGAYIHLVLTNGTRFSVVAPTIRDGIFRARTIYKDEIALPIAEIAAIDIYQGPAIYLSDLKPTKYSYRSYLGEQFTWNADRDLSGGEMRIRGKNGVSNSDKGIAVHGECRMTYALDGKYRRFESLAGLDARLGKHGSVELRAVIDGKEQKLGDGKQLTLESGPWPIRLDVTGTKELTLIVLWGLGGNVGDHVNWADARLIP